MKRKYKINENVFDEITPNSSYWAGFLMADGCVVSYTRKLNYKPSYNIVLSISSKDKPHLQKYLSFLNSTHPIKIRETKFNNDSKPSSLATVSITSERIKTALSKFGVVPRKSLTATCVPKLKNSIDFWRGMVDGDGWIYTTFNNLPAIGLIGSMSIVKDFENFVKSYAVECTATITKKKGAKVYQFQTAGESAQKIITILYKNCHTSLDRKQNIAQKIIDNPFKSSKKSRKSLTYEELLRMHFAYGDWYKVSKKLKLTYQSLMKLLWRKHYNKR